MGSAAESVLTFSVCALSCECLLQEVLAGKQEQSSSPSVLVPAAFASLAISEIQFSVQGSAWRSFVKLL